MGESNHRARTYWSRFHLYLRELDKVMKGGKYLLWDLIESKLDERSRTEFKRKVEEDEETALMWVAYRLSKSDMDWIETAVKKSIKYVGKRRKVKKPIRGRIRLRSKINKERKRIEQLRGFFEKKIGERVDFPTHPSNLEYLCEVRKALEKLKEDCDELYSRSPLKDIIQECLERALEGKYEGIKLEAELKVDTLRAGISKLLRRLQPCEGNCGGMGYEKVPFGLKERALRGTIPVYCDASVIGKLINKEVCPITNHPFYEVSARILLDEQCELYTASFTFDQLKKGKNPINRQILKSIEELWGIKSNLHLVKVPAPFDPSFEDLNHYQAAERVNAKLILAYDRWFLYKKIKTITPESLLGYAALKTCSELCEATSSNLSLKR